MVSLKTKIVATACAMLAIVAGVVGLVNYSITAGGVARLQSDSLRVAASYNGRTLKENLEAHRLVIERMANGRPVRKYAVLFQENALVEYFSKFKNTFSVIAYLDQSGTEDVTVVDGEPSDELSEWGTSSLWLAANAAFNQIHWRFVNNRPGGTPAIVRFMTVRQSYFEEFQGALMAEIPIATLWQSILLDESRPDLNYLLLDRDGHLILSSFEVPPAEVRFDPDKIKQICRRKSPTQSNLTLMGRESVVAIEPLDGTPWVLLAGMPIEVYMRAPRGVALATVAITIAALLITVLVAIVLSNRITKPLARLVQATQGLSDGDYSTRVVDNSPGELGILEARFNQMAQKVAHTKNQLEQRVAARTAELIDINRQLTGEVDVRKNAEKSVQTAYDELRQTQAQLIHSAKLASMGELAAGVAHELNQPLTVIRTTGHLIRRLLARDGTDINKLREVVEPLDRNTKRMTEIINHLRSFSREAGAESRAVDVGQVIDNTRLMIGAQLKVHNIDLVVAVAPEVPKVSANPYQLEQVLLNLITNARDALQGIGQESDDEALNSQKGRIEIEARRASGNPPALEICVSDSGPGIPAGIRDRIFDPFFTTKPEGEGTGLGLSVSYGIISNHKGILELARSDRHGTTFRVKLPLYELDE